MLLQGSTSFRSDDRPLHVVARAVAANVGPTELDRPVVGSRRDALDEEGRRPTRLVEETCLSGTQQHRFERLAGAGDPGAIASLQEPVQRFVLQIASEQSREPLGRQVDHLQEERVAVGDAQPLEIERRRARFEGQGRRHGLAGGFRPGRDEARHRIQPTALHLGRERQRFGEVALDALWQHGRPPAAGALDATLADELAQGAPDGDQAAAVVLGEVALRGQPVAGLPAGIVQ